MARGNFYSRIVEWLRIALPLIAIGILSTLFLLSEAPDPERALPYAEVDVAQLARELRLSEPRFAGVTPEGREITLRAEAAAPDFEMARQISPRRHSTESADVAGLVREQLEYFGVDPDSAYGARLALVAIDQVHGHAGPGDGCRVLFSRFLCLNTGLDPRVEVSTFDS